MFCGNLGNKLVPSIAISAHPCVLVCYMIVLVRCSAYLARPHEPALGQGKWVRPIGPGPLGRTNWAAQAQRSRYGPGPVNRADWVFKLMQKECSIRYR